MLMVHDNHIECDLLMDNSTLFVSFYLIFYAFNYIFDKQYII